MRRKTKKKIKTLKREYGGRLGERRVRREGGEEVGAASLGEREREREGERERV